MNITKEYEELFNLLEDKIRKADNQSAYIYALWYLAQRLRFTSASLNDPCTIEEMWLVIEAEARSVNKQEFDLQKGTLPL